MDIPCLILGGGLGTRMRPLTARVPKALLPVAGSFFADWQLRSLASQGVARVVYSVGYLGDQIKAALGDGRRWGLDIEFVDDGEVLLGTGGAVRKAIDVAGLDTFFVLYGDSYLQVQFSAVADAFNTSHCPALMTVMRNCGQWGASNADYADGLVLRYAKGVVDGAPMSYIDYGLLLFEADVVRERVAPGRTADLAGLCTHLTDAGRLAGFEATERFFEIGSPQGLADLEELLGQGRGAPEPQRDGSLRG
jgi:N-acetyl-alpha-D-muramate 1-phosphate uridylyltransferase